MIRASLYLSALFCCLTAYGAPEAAEKQSAAEVQAPVMPPLASPVAPPMPGQLQAAPSDLKPAAGVPPPPVPIPAAGPTAPRPALEAPSSRIPDLPKPALTPAPTVPLSKTNPKQASSTSSSGQFIVHGDDLKLRSAFSGRCEEIAESLRQLLRDKQPWALPVVVLLKTGDAARAPGPAASAIISQISHGGFHLQVTVNVRGDLRPSDLRAEVVKVLLAERILRSHQQLASNRERLLPDWVFVGVLEAMDYRKRARPSALFAAIFKSGKIYGIEEIIEASASAIEDGLSKTIYQTSCCALLLALLDQPDGGMRLTKFLNSLASDKRPERELLNQWFPGFAATPASLNKWWSLQMASLATPSVSEPLSAAETMKQLEDALTLRFKASPGELPKPRPVVAATTAPEAAAPKPAAEPAAAPAEITEEDKKPSFIKRLLTFEKKERSDAEVIEEAAAEAELAEAEVKPERPSRRPMFSRKPDKEETIEQKPADATEAAAVEKPAVAAAPKETPPGAKKEVPAPVEKEESTAADEKPAEEKGSILNPLKWFRGGKKKEDQATPEEKKAEEKQASAKSGAAQLLWAWSPLAGDVWTMAEAAVEDEAPKSKRTEGFLGLKFGRKKKDAAEPEAPKADAPKQEAPKQSNKRESKTEPPAAPAQPEQSKTTEAKPAPAPIKIKPLFGGKKKDSEEPAKEEPEAPAEKVPEPAPKVVTSTRKPVPQAKSSDPAEAALPIEDYAVVLKRKDKNEILGRNVNALANLQTRASVLFRPIVTEYAQVVSELAEGKTKGADERLRTLRARANQALEQSKAVRDFVDLYQANESPVLSGLFEDYLKLPETINSELPPRMDPLSSYLDALDREFSKE